VIAIAGLFAYQIGPFSHDKIDLASPKDVRFVLNWCELGDQKIEKVLHSYVSARSFTGDHLDAYAIKISRIDISELTSKTDNVSGRWYRGDHLPKVLDEAIAFVGIYRSEIASWFPTEAELRSAEFYVYPGSIYFHGVTPTAAELIFVRPSDQMIYYIGSKT
jgi:hypothetical protein